MDINPQSQDQLYLFYVEQVPPNQHRNLFWLIFPQKYAGLKS